MAEEYTLYTVEWDGPFQFEISAPRSRTAKDRFHLYRLHGPHPLYGPSVLLYIGQTKKGRGRIVQHFEGLIQSYQRIVSPEDGETWCYYKGRISRDDGQSISPMDVCLVEQHLIRCHVPAANSDHLCLNKSVSSWTIVTNRGEIGKLKPRSAVSTRVEYHVPTVIPMRK
jgi:hypothetical protein